MFSEEGSNAEEAVFMLRKEVQGSVDSVRLERSERLLGFHVRAREIGVEMKEMFKGEGFTDCPIESNCSWVRTGVAVPLYVCWESNHGIGGGKTGKTEIGWWKIANYHAVVGEGVFIVCVGFTVQNSMMFKGLLGQILGCGESVARLQRGGIKIADVGDNVFFNVMEFGIDVRDVFGSWVVVQFGIVKIYRVGEKCAVAKSCIEEPGNGAERRFV